MIQLNKLILICAVVWILVASCVADATSSAEDLKPPAPPAPPMPTPPQMPSIPNIFATPPSKIPTTDSSYFKSSDGSLDAFRDSGFEDRYEYSNVKESTLINALTSGRTQTGVSAKTDAVDTNDKDLLNNKNNNAKNSNSGERPRKSKKKPRKDQSEPANESSNASSGYGIQYLPVYLPYLVPNEAKVQYGNLIPVFPNGDESVYGNQRPPTTNEAAASAKTSSVSTSVNTPDGPGTNSAFATENSYQKQDALLFSTTKTSTHLVKLNSEKGYSATSVSTSSADELVDELEKSPSFEELLAQLLTQF